MEQSAWNNVRDELIAYMRLCMKEETLTGDDAMGLISAAAYAENRAMGMTDIEMLGGGFHA
jgi:hypothetical protein